jgi:HD-like signal output (HDOD) protein
MTKTLLENIESIPPLPESIQEVERIYQDSESTFEDMQKAIEKDPLLTANVLRLVNSPMYGVKSTISSVKQAISLLGKDAVRSMVLASAVDTNFDIDLSPYNMTKEEFVAACDKQLALTLAWLGRKEPENIAYLAPAALLVDIGRVIIAKTLVEDNKVDIIQQALLAGEDISAAEKTACGAQATDVTATLFHQWGFDPEIVHIIRYSDDPEGATPDEKQMAAELKAVRETVLPNGDITDESIAIAKDTIEEFELDMQSYEQALHKIQES